MRETGTNERTENQEDITTIKDSYPVAFADFTALNRQE